MSDANRGLFLSGLDWLGSLSGPVKNTLRGNLGGVGRQTVDILGDILDAALPGDWIPHIAKPEDDVEVTDLLGIDREKNPVIGGVTDFLGEILLNPSTYVSGASIGKFLGKTGKLASKGAAMLPEAAQPTVAAAKKLGQEAGKLTKRVFSDEKPSKFVDELTRDAGGAAASVARASEAAIEEIVSGTTPEVRKKAFQIINNIHEKEPGVWDEIERSTEAANPDYDLMPRQKRAEALKDKADHAPYVREWKLNDLDEMLGVVGPKKPSMGFENVPVSNIDRLNQMVYGTKAEMERTGARNLPELKGSFDSVEGSLERWAQRIDQMPWSQAEKDQVAELLSKVAPYTQRQYREAVEDLGAMFREEGIDITKQSPSDYAHRSYTGLTTEKDLELTGNQSALSERVLKTGESLADFLNANKDVKLEMDLGKSLFKRSGQQARMAERAKIGKGLIKEFAERGEKKKLENPYVYDDKSAPTDFETGIPNKSLPYAPTPAENAAIEAKYSALAQPEFRTAVNSIIKEIAKTSPDDAHVLGVHFNGLDPQNKFLEVLTRLTRPFKAAAVFGYAIPKFSFEFSNRLSGILQVAAEKSARPATPGMLKRFFPDLAMALDDSLVASFGLKRHVGGKITQDLDAATAAFKASGGVASRALELMPQRVREAYESGVLDSTFIDQERMLDGIGKTGLSKKWSNLTQWPAELQKAIEQRMRYGVFSDLVDGGMKVKDAAKASESALFSYKMSSNENRLARTLVPFFQFQARATQQTAKVLAEKPFVATTMASLLREHTDQPLYPWMEGKANFPLGKDEEGNDQYLTSFRLPFESLMSFPNPSADLLDFGRQAEQGIVGSANPLLKFAYSAFSGREPYFASEFGSYDKIPGVGHAGELGRQYNKVAATGLIQPVDSLLHLAGGVTDERHSAPVKFLDMLTGVNVASVDPDLAQQKQLQEELLRNPQVDQYRGFYQKSADPETQQLIHDYKAAKDAAKKKRAAEGALL